MADPQVPGYTGMANTQGAFQGVIQTPGTQDQETLVPAGTSSPTGPAGGDLTGTYPNPTLVPLFGGPTGPIGSSTSIPVITIDAKGRVTALTSVPNGVFVPASNQTSGVLDTAAIKNALSTYGYCLLYPNQVYWINQQIVLPDLATLACLGDGWTTMRQAANTNLQVPMIANQNFVAPPLGYPSVGVLQGVVKGIVIDVNCTAQNYAGQAWLTAGPDLINGPDAITICARDYTIDVQVVNAVRHGVVTVDTNAGPAPVGSTQAGVVGVISGNLATTGALATLPVALGVTLPSPALPLAVGSIVTLVSGVWSQQWTVNATVHNGDTSISVVPQVPNFAYPGGTNIYPTLNGAFTYLGGGLLPANRTTKNNISGNVVRFLVSGWAYLGDPVVNGRTGVTGCTAPTVGGPPIPGTNQIVLGTITNAPGSPGLGVIPGMVMYGAGVAPSTIVVSNVAGLVTLSRNLLPNAGTAFNFTWGQRGRWNTQSGHGNTDGWEWGGCQIRSMNGDWMAKYDTLGGWRVAYQQHFTSAYGVAQHISDGHGIIEGSTHANIGPGPSNIPIQLGSLGVAIPATGAGSTTSTITLQAAATISMTGAAAIATAHGASTAITSLGINASTVHLGVGSTVTLTDATPSSQIWVLTGDAPVGSTTLAVASQVPNDAYPANTPVTPGIGVPLQQWTPFVIRTVTSTGAPGTPIVSCLSLPALPTDITLSVYKIGPPPTALAVGTPFYLPLVGNFRTAFAGEDDQLVYTNETPGNDFVYHFILGNSVSFGQDTLNVGVVRAQNGSGRKDSNGLPASAPLTVTVAQNSSAVVDTGCVSSDQGAYVYGPGIPPNTFAYPVTPGTGFGLSSSPNAVTPTGGVLATASGTEVELGISGATSVAAAFVGVGSSNPWVIRNAGPGIINEGTTQCLETYTQAGTPTINWVDGVPGAAIPSAAPPTPQLFTPSLSVGTLSSTGGLTAFTPVTTLSTNPLTEVIPANALFVLTNGGANQVFQNGGTQANIGATTINLAQSTNPYFSFPGTGTGTTTISLFTSSTTSVMQGLGALAANPVLYTPSGSGQVTVTVAGTAFATGAVVEVATAGSTTNLMNCGNTAGIVPGMIVTGGTLTGTVTVQSVVPNTSVTTTGGTAVFASGSIYTFAAIIRAVNIAGKYGTGTPPGNGVAATGSTFQQGTVNFQPQNISNGTPFTLIDTEALTVGTQYWFDIAAWTSTQPEPINLGGLVINISETA